MLPPFSRFRAFGAGWLQMKSSPVVVVLVDGGGGGGDAIDFLTKIYRK